MPEAVLYGGNIATTSADHAIIDIAVTPTEDGRRCRLRRRRRTDSAGSSQLVDQGEQSHGLQDGPNHQRLLFMPPEEHRSHMAQTDPKSLFEIKFLHAKPEMELYDQILPHLKAVGLYHCTMFRHFKLDHALLTALTERWRPETHTFHMPCGEMTITLEDVACMLGLPTDGYPVKGEIQTDWSGEIVRLLGIELDGQAESYIRLSQLRRAISERGPLTNDCTKDVIAQYARAFILELFGCLLFPYSSKKCVRCYFLPLLEDLSGQKRYSWGSAVLAFLYRKLDDSVMLSQGQWRKTIGGANILLQLWCWTRFSIGRPTPMPYDRWGQPDLQSCGPYGCYWIGNREYQKTPCGPSTKFYRNEFEHVTENMVVWTPYLAFLGWMPEMVHEEIARLVWFVRAPLIYFTVVEWHYPERVTRQFGYRQPNPPPLPESWTVHEHLRKIKDPITGRIDDVLYRDACDKWNKRTPIRILGPYQPNDCDANMHWYGIHGMPKLELNETQSASPELKRLKKYMETAAQFIGSYAVQNITPSHPEEPKNKIFMAQTILLLLLAISMVILYIMMHAPFADRDRITMFFSKLFIYGSNIIMMLVPLFLLVIHTTTYTILAPLPILAILVIIYLVRRGSSPENYRDYDDKLDNLMALCSGWTVFAFGGLSFLVLTTPAQLKNDVTECFLYCTIVIGLIVMLLTSVPPAVPTGEPTDEPTGEPTGEPTDEPTGALSFQKKKAVPTTMRMVKIVESLGNTLLALLILVGLMSTGEIVQGFVVITTFLHIAGATVWFIKELNHKHEEAEEQNSEHEVGNMSSTALRPNVDEQQQNRESEHVARRSSTATTPKVDEVFPNYFGAFLLAGLIYVHSRYANNSDGKIHDIPLLVCMLSLCSAFICCLSRMFILANSANTPAWTSAKVISFYITYFSVVVAFIASFVFVTV